ncbi:hypothetical protein JTE90_006025 [Oedothorax gibbosus]|uniref:Apterous n=1 Tax=Oedothorax gibbosus TaxID=931172 RepID=A0AAV6V2S2_9ARAC|nr:hypothetical protein JTE90_006025 [Oedothorax gibbosus]
MSPTDGCMSDHSGTTGPGGGPVVLCAGCGGGISDRYYLLAVDRQWHASCLTCCQCRVQLDSELTCFARDGHIYCKEDYYRLFSVKRCTRCHLSISPNELVMRARDHVYHLHCFTCAACNRPLTKGDYFGLKDDVIYCRPHYEAVLQYDSPTHRVLKEEQHDRDLDGLGTGGVGGGAVMGLNQQIISLNGSEDHDRHLSLCAAVASAAAGVAKTPGQKGRPRKQKGFLSSSSLLLPHRGPSVCSGEDGSSPGLQLHLSDSSTSSEHHMSRPKRMRTSFKHHQLRAMKSYFSVNHNPDAKDLKQLSQKTGLSKRVLQVWFQNARAKWRRNLLRQQSQGPEIAQDCKPLSELASQPQFCDPFRLGSSSILDMQPTPITQEEQNIQTFTNLL